MASVYSRKPHHNKKNKENMSYADILKSEQAKGRYLDVKLSDYKSTRDAGLSMYDVGRCSNRLKN